MAEPPTGAPLMIFPHPERQCRCKHQSSWLCPHQGCCYTGVKYNHVKARLAVQARDLADKALASFIIIQAALKRSRRLHQYTLREDLNKRMPNFQVTFFIINEVCGMESVLYCITSVHVSTTCLVCFW